MQVFYRHQVTFLQKVILVWSFTQGRAVFILCIKEGTSYGKSYG